MTLGFLGGGVNSIAGRVHFIASQMDKKFEVVGGIFSKDKDKSKISAKEYGVKHFDTIEDMVKEVGLVVVLTPTPDHFENLKELLEYDIGIIVDKPLVDNLKNIDELNFDKKFVVVTHNYSGYPLVREIRALTKNTLRSNISLNTCFLFILAKCILS
jgi:predicted dehydrogenase